MRRLIASTSPPVPLIATTSPTRTWFSRIRKNPPIRSRTRLCAPKPSATPMMPAPVSAGRDVHAELAQDHQDADDEHDEGGDVGEHAAERAWPAWPARAHPGPVPKLTSCSKRLTPTVTRRTSGDKRPHDSRTLSPESNAQLLSVRSSRPARGRRPTSSKAGKISDDEDNAERRRTRSAAAARVRAGSEVVIVSLQQAAHRQRSRSGGPSARQATPPPRARATSPTSCQS